MLNTTQTTFTTATDFLKAIADVDILMDETYTGANMTAFLANYQIPNGDQAKYKFLKNNKVFRLDGILTESGGYDWFEAPVAMADALLEDMINAVNANAPKADYRRNWLRNIALNETIKYSTAGNCSWAEGTPRPNLATQFNGAAFTLDQQKSTSGAHVLTTGLAFAVSLASLAYLS